MPSSLFQYIDPTTQVAKNVEFVSQSTNTAFWVNPAIRMYYMDKATMELVDFEQYYLDITEGITVIQTYIYWNTKCT